MWRPCHHSRYARETKKQNNTNSKINGTEREGKETTACSKEIIQIRNSILCSLTSQIDEERTSSAVSRKVFDSVADVRRPEWKHRTALVRRRNPSDFRIVPSLRFGPVDGPMRVRRVHVDYHVVRATEESWALSVWDEEINLHCIITMLYGIQFNFRTRWILSMDRYSFKP